MSDADVRAHIEAAQRELDAALAALDAGNGTGGGGGTDPIDVMADDALAQVLADAPPGATLRLASDGMWVLTDYTFTKPATLITADPLPAGRVSPDQDLPLLIGHLTLCPDVAFIGLHLEGPHPDGTIITCSDRTLLDRCRILGSASGQHRGVRVDGAGIRIVGCTITNIWKDIDTQAVVGWDGCRDLIVQDCLLEASGENVLFGGADASSADRMPENILIEGCTLSKPLAWRDQAATTSKNLFELKAARSVMLRDCTLEYSWEDGQAGFAIVLTPRNNDGGAPWSTIEHVVIEDCVIRHCGSGVQLMGDDDRGPSFASGRMSDVEIRGCSVEDIDPQAWGGSGRLFQITRGPQRLVVTDCTLSGQHLNSALTFEDPSVPCEGLVFQRTTMPSGEYGIKCPEVAMGAPTLDLYAPGYVWEDMTIVADPAGNPIAWPPGTTVVPLP